VAANTTLIAASAKDDLLYAALDDADRTTVRMFPTSTAIDTAV
jgi:hypothetical protein